MTNPRDVVFAERAISALAAAIFDVLADPARHPEIDGSGSVRSARPGSSARLSAGASFGMDMRRGVPYAMINTVTEFDEGRLIAWSPRPATRLGARFAGRIWRNELKPVDGGTRVRETWDISHEALRFFLRYAAAILWITVNSADHLPYKGDDLHCSSIAPQAPDWGGGWRLAGPASLATSLVPASVQVDM